MSNIVLTGFMGTGKTTVGRLLAARLGYGFVDTDEWIVQQDGRSIADIFKEDGEAVFRQWEATVSQQLAGQDGLVIATGGRLMLDAANAEALERNGQVFCLVAEPEEILTRIAPDEHKRPLLDVPNPAERVRHLLTQRAVAYGRFWQIRTSGKTPEQVAEEILVGSTQYSVLSGADSVPVEYPEGYYFIRVGSGLLPHLRQMAGFAGQLVVVTDEHVGALHDVGEETAVITLPAGEQHKTLDTIRLIYDGLLAAGLDRKGTVVALGGGVIGDMAGFAAATYMRGVNFVQCPTSLLAMVDSSIGGKTGVDVPQGKNLIGAFKQPTAVIADLNTLRTLPPAEFAAGMAEIIKHGLLVGGNLWQQLLNQEFGLQSPISNLQSLIVQAIQVKRDVVEVDPFEQGIRVTLNLGHTFGHAIEQVSRYVVRHGEGVAMGLVAAANLSVRLGYCAPEIQTTIEQVLVKNHLPVRIPGSLPADALLAAMRHDKKKAGGRVRFVLMRAVGDVFVTGDVPETAVLETIKDISD